MGRFNATALPRPEPATPPAPQITVLPPPPAAPKKRALDFGGIAKKEATAASDYPVLPDPDGTLAAQAAAFLEALEAETAAAGAKEAARFELVTAARPFHFQVNSGHAEIPSSVSIHSPKGEVRVTFKDAYKKLDEAKFSLVQQVIGESLATAYMAQTFEFKITSENIPEAKMQEVIDAMREMATRLGITDAVSVATCYKPTAEWHTARFRQLTPEQNLRLEAVIDREKGFCQAAVGPVRGRK
jgi:hypothetical protein